MNSNDIKVAFEQIEKFSQIAGVLNHNNHEATLDNVSLYIDLMKEENEETNDAFTHEDAVELLDGACDQFVIAASTLQVLKAAGFNVEKALARVVANNLTKFPTEHEFKANPDLQPVGSYVETNPYGHVVFKRDFDGKVMKPTNYVPVDLVSCVPDSFFKGE